MVLGCSSVDPLGAYRLQWQAERARSCITTEVKQCQAEGVG